MRLNNHGPEPIQIRFEPTPEIFATDNSGRFSLILRHKGKEQIETGSFDEIRFVFSIWHPSSKRSIDLDHAYVELGCRLNIADEHWVKLAEIEPVVPPYHAGSTFDGWIVLPVLGTTTAYELTGSGFTPRARVQIRANAYLVS